MSEERKELLKSSSSRPSELSDSSSLTDTGLREDEYTESTVAVNKCPRSKHMSGLQESCVHTTFDKNQNIPGDEPIENSERLKNTSMNWESDDETESESLLKDVYTEHNDKNRIRKAKDFSLKIGMNGNNRFPRADPVMLQACLENEAQTQVKVLDNFGNGNVSRLIKVENERKTPAKTPRRRNDTSKRLKSRRKRTDRISEDVRITADRSLETEQRQTSAFDKGREMLPHKKQTKMSLADVELQRRVIAEYYDTDCGLRNDFQTENTQACNSITSSTECSSHQYLSLGSRARKCNFHTSRGCSNEHINFSNPHLGDSSHYQLSNRHMINKEQCCPKTLYIVPETRGGPKIPSCSTSNPSNDSAYLHVLNAAGRKSKCCDDSCNKHFFRKASFVLLLINILVVGIATILLLSKTNHNSLVPGEGSEGTTSRAQKQISPSNLSNDTEDDETDEIASMKKKTEILIEEMEKLKTLTQKINCSLTGEASEGTTSKAQKQILLSNRSNDTEDDEIDEIASMKNKTEILIEKMKKMETLTQKLNFSLTELNFSVTDLHAKQIHVMQFKSNGCHSDAKIKWKTELLTRKIALLEINSTMIQLQDNGIYYVYGVSTQTGLQLKTQDANGIHEDPISSESNSFGFAYKKKLKDKDSFIFVQGCKGVNVGDVKLGLLLLL